MQLSIRPESLEPTLRDGIGFRRRAALKPGVYQVRVAVLGEGPDEIGSASESIEVPDLAGGRLTVSSVFLAGVREVGRESGGVPGIDAARRFPAGSEVDLVLFAYNARQDASGATDLAVRFQLRADGAVIHEFFPRSMRPADTGPPERVPYGARFSLAGLPPGEYELRALVEDRKAAVTAERSAAFVVE